MLVFKFVMFIIYTTIIFFLPNMWQYLLLIILINLIIWLIVKPDLLKFGEKMVKFLPFIVLAFIFNIIFDNISNAVFVSAKLALVCTITIIYASTITLNDLNHILITLLHPSQKLGLNFNELTLLICLSIAIILTMVHKATEIKQALKAKNIRPSVEVVRLAVLHLVTNAVSNINSIDEALRAKGIF